MANLNESGSSSLAGLAFNSIIFLPLRQDLLRQPPLRELLFQNERQVNITITAIFVISLILFIDFFLILSRAFFRVICFYRIMEVNLPQVRAEKPNK